MAMVKEQIQDWLDGLHKGALVGVDDGGLCLQVVGEEWTYCEIGGLPLPEDDSDEDDNET